VEKLPLDKWESRFREKVIELGGPVIVQPYIKAVEKGEVRSVFFKGRELGSIMKTPKDGEFLSNIAQGATFGPHTLSETSRRRCEEVVRELAAHGVDWIAFDILADSITEVNITCPGLLVEVSYAHKRNLADELIELLLS
jgi:glutathione synthase